MLTMSNIADALKLFYLPGLRYQLNDQASAFLAQIEKSTEEVVGREIRMAMRYGRQGGVGNRADDGTLPTPNSRRTKQAAWETKNIFARFQLTDKTIEASKSNVGAFASMLQQEIEDCETDARLDLSRQALGNGVGVLCTVSQGDYAGGVVTVTVDTTMYLAEGMYVDIIAPDDTVKSQEVEIISVPSSTTFIYAASSDPLLVSGDQVFVAGNKNKELTGLDAVVSTGGTLYGINRDEHPWLNSNVFAVNGAIAETRIQAGIDEVETKSGSETNFLLCSKGVARAYQNLQTAMKQHVNTLDLKGGWTGLSYAGGKKPIPLVSDKYVLPNRLYGLDLNDWKMYQMADWNWLDRDGSMLTRVANKPVWEATLVKYCDLGCQRPRGQFVMTGITEL